MLDLQSKQLEEFRKIAFPVTVPGWWDVRYAMIATSYGENKMTGKFVSEHHPHFFVITQTQAHIAKNGLFDLVDFPDSVFPIDIERKDENGHFVMVGDVALYTLPTMIERKFVSSAEQRKIAFDNYIENVYSGNVPKHLMNLKTDIDTNIALQVVFEAKRRENMCFEAMNRYQKVIGD